MNSARLLSKQVNAFVSANEKHKALYESILEEHQNEIITQFGGLSQMIDLCLTSNYGNSLFDQHQLTAFGQLLFNNGIMIHRQSKPNLENSGNNTPLVIDDDCNYNYPQNIYKQQTKNINIDNHVRIDSIDPITIDIDIKQHSSNNNTNNNTININEDTFEHILIVVERNIDNNLYFKYLSRHYASYFVHDVLLSKWFSKLTIFILLVSWCLFAIYYRLFITNIATVSYSTVIILYIVGLMTFLLIVIYILLINTYMFDSITHTFDFWFKTYNLIMYRISSWMYGFAIGFDYPLWFQVLSDMLFVSGYIFGFMIDGIPVNNKFRTIFVLALAIFSMAEVVQGFFEYPDAYYNPFKSNNETFGEYTNISIKSLYLSSLVNIVLFITKPCFTILISIVKIFQKKMKNMCIHIRNNCDIKSNNINVDNGYDCSFVLDLFATKRCSSIYKRPYTIWYSNHDP